MHRIDYGDQTKLFDPRDFTDEANIVGMGTTGQAVFSLLLKFGIRVFHLWDDDTAAEPHNIPVQLISGPAHVGMPKVEMCRRYAHEGWLGMGEDFVIHTHEERVTADTRLSGVVIVGTDSMSSRKEIWQAVKRSITRVPFYMDGRIGGLEWELLAFEPTNARLARNYESFLIEDARASDEECGASKTIHVSMAMACVMVERLRRWHQGILDTSEDFWAMRNLGLEE